MSDVSDSSSDWVSGQPWRPQGLDQIASMDRATRAAYERAAEVYTFGVGFQRDGAGRPIETGIGSEHNMSQQAVAALRAEAERKALLKVAAAAAPAATAAVPADAAALQEQIDDLKAQLAALGVTPAAAPAA
jgi:hypothetical protein